MSNIPDPQKGNRFRKILNLIFWLAVLVLGIRVMSQLEIPPMFWFFGFPTVLLVIVIIWSVVYQARRMSKMNGLNSKQGTVATWVQRSDTTFDDVAGCDEVKEDVEMVIEFVKNPARFEALGAEMPKGILLVGSPGTGKTLIAKAIAGEAGVAFGHLNGADFVEMFVGVGARRVRDLFAEAKANAPCIVFIDEIEGLGAKRGGFQTHRESDNTLIEFLGLMDGFNPNLGVIFVGATNQPETLDPALLRGGRFERHIYLPMPDVKGREQILKVHAKKKKMAENVDLAEIARMTPMLAGAELKKIINEAAIIATLREAPAIEQQDLITGIDQALYGPERKNSVRPKSEMEIAAYHEAGHTLVAKTISGGEPVTKVTIIPRGESGGATYMNPDEEIRIYTRKYLFASMAVAAGGRAAEMYKFRQESSGASNDFSRATDCAKRMVQEWGMSKVVGNRVFVTRSQFLGSNGALPDCSEETRALIDKEIKKLLNETYSAAYGIIRGNADKLEALAQELLKKETLDGKEVDEIFRQVEKNRKESPD